MKLTQSESEALANLSTGVIDNVNIYSANVNSGILNNTIQTGRPIRIHRI